MPSVLNTAVAQGGGSNQMILATRDVFSAEIFYVALPVMKFDQFSTKRSELGVQPGRRIQIPKYNSLKRGGKLVEGRRLNAQPMSMSQSSIEVDEYGNAINFSEMLLQTSFFDQLSAASLLLGRDMAIVLDTVLRDAILLGGNVVYGGGVSARASVTAAGVMTTQVVKDVVEVLQTNNAPKWAGDHYVGFMHPHQGRGLRDDSDWINASLYSGATAIYTGEVGRYEDVRFIVTTVMANGANNAVDPATGDPVDIGYEPTLRGAGAGGIHLYQAVFFGEYSLGHATALPVELRDNGVTDYGREHGLAWYSIFGQEILEEQNIVIAETA